MQRRYVVFLLIVLRMISNGRFGLWAQTEVPHERHLHQVTRLTFDGDNGEAYFSWDDAQLIWQSNRGGYDCDKIWIMRSDGSDKRMVSPNHGAHTCAFFFPGNATILFASTSHLPGACPPKPDVRFTGKYSYTWPLYPYNIFTAGADGSDMRRLTTNPQYDAEPVVSSDGQEIVFGSQREGDFDVYIMRADGSNLRRLTDQVGYDGGPWFSPDGRKIVWRAWYPETPADMAMWREWMTHSFIAAVPLDLWVMDRDGSHKVRLTHNGAVNWAPSWTPEGKRIIFSSNMDDWREAQQTYGYNFELYLINSDGTNLERVTFNTVFDSFPMFSHDGTKLVFASNRDPHKPRATDIYLADWVE
jgi:Tol biopolymer transport system component